jgi:hypothetical protein
VDYQQDDWVRLLPVVQFAFNSVVSETTKVLPFYTNYSFEPEVYKIPMAIELPV